MDINIMVFMGSYIKNDSNDYLTYERDPDTSYKIYIGGCRKTP